MDNKYKIIFGSIFIGLIFIIVAVITTQKSNFENKNIKNENIKNIKYCVTSLDCDNKSICINNKCLQIKFDEITTNSENNLINGKFGFFKKYFKNTR